MSRKAIGIDIGTTTISAVVMDTTTHHIIEARTIANHSFIPSEYAWERIQDVNVIVKKAQGVLEELLGFHPDAASIGLTGQMHGIVYVDAEGKAVSPLYTWQDGRGEQPVLQGGEPVKDHGTTASMREAHKATADGAVQASSPVCAIRKLAGIEAYAGYGCVTHYYNVKQQLVPEGAKSFCTIADYLGMVLTGRKKPLVHISNAAGMGLFDVKNGCFYQDKLQILGIDCDMLPQVTDTFEVLGSFQAIPVTVALGDNQASFLGAAGTETATVLINMGTGGQVSVLTDQYFEAPGVEARPFMKGSYLLVGASLCGGRAYAILEQFFHSYLKAAGVEAGAQYALMEKLARTVSEESKTLHVTTTFHGTRDNPAKRGSICGISEDNFTPAQVIYGTLAGMAEELFGRYQQIHEGTGVKAGKLIASGNGLRKNALLREIFAGLFGQEVMLAQCEEEAASGAALSSVLLEDHLEKKQM